MGKEQEYREIFLAEAQESQEQLNMLFTDLEKDISNKRAIDAIFRITHTLKGNAMGMGFSEIAELGHVMEDVFNEVKTGKLTLDHSLFDSLYKANDVLSELIEAIKTPKTVRYKGIKTKLEVILKNARGYVPSETNNPATADNVNLKVSQELPDEVLEFKNTSSEISGNVEPEKEEEIQEEEVVTKIVLSDTVQVPVRKLDALLNI